MRIHPSGVSSSISIRPLSRVPSGRLASTRIVLPGQRCCSQSKNACSWATTAVLSTTCAIPYAPRVCSTSASCTFPVAPAHTIQRCIAFPRTSISLSAVIATRTPTGSDLTTWKRPPSAVARSVLEKRRTAYWRRHVPATFRLLLRWWHVNFIRVPGSSFSEKSPPRQQSARSAPIRVRVD